MKELYSFYVSRKQEVDVETDTPEGKLIKKEIKSVPIRVTIKKPSRIETQQAELEYSKQWSLALKEGILPKAVLTKIFADVGGTVSKEEAEEQLSIYEKYGVLQNDLQSLKFKNINEDNVEVKEQIDELTREMVRLLNKIQDFESKQSKAYDQCAEVRARNKTIQWLLLNLTYVEYDEGKPELFFKGKNDEEKADHYFSMIDAEENNEFNEKVVDKAVLVISFWYLGNAETKEDFEQLEKSAESRNDGENT